MSETYSTYEAKAKLSEILRKVESGRTVGISRHGRLIAEIRPVRLSVTSLEERLEELAQAGTITRSSVPASRLAPLASRPGAVQRFLADRDR